MIHLSNNPFRNRGGFIAAAVIISTALVLGGGATKAGLPLLVMLIAGLIGGLCLISDNSGLKVVRIPWIVITTFVLILILPLVQLIPLPPEIWKNLPGREAETAIIVLAGGGDLDRPNALKPIANLQFFAAFVVSINFSLVMAKIGGTVFKTRF